MKIILHPHALQRAIERGAIEEEIFQTVTEGEHFPAKFGRTGFRLNFHFENIWNGHFYNTKQIELFAVFENETWIVITMIIKYF
jgi:hypothetical protein